MQTKNLVRFVVSIAGVLAGTAGSLAAQNVPHTHSIPSDATFGASPGTLGTDVYRQPEVTNCWCGEEDLEVIDDLHLTQAGNLVSFDFTYCTFRATATSVTAYINFYDNDPTDSIDPLLPTDPGGLGGSTLLGSVVVPGLPVGPPGGFLLQTETVDLTTPIALPQDIWMGIRMDLEGVTYANCSRNVASAAFRSSTAPPDLGGNDPTYIIRFLNPAFGSRANRGTQNTVTLRMGSAPPTNHPPLCAASYADAEANFLSPSPGVFVVTEGETITVPFTGIDQDLENLNVTATTNGSPGLPGTATTATLSPTSGIANPSLTSTFQWTPIAGDKTGAPYDVIVTFTDAAGASASCTLGIDDINLKPVCSASNQTVQCTSPAGAVVTLDGSATDADDSNLSFHWDISNASVVVDDEDIAMPTGTFPIGVTMATLTVTDGRGGVSMCDVQITVEDTVPPDVECTTDMASLWPPNHKMRTINVVVKATDECTDPSAIQLMSVNITSDEPDDAAGKGDGKTTGDVNGQDGFGGGIDITSLLTYDAMTEEWTGTIQLRAERQGNGDGRRYTIDVTALDAAVPPNSATTSCCVVVPHDNRPN